MASVLVGVGSDVTTLLLPSHGIDVAPSKLLKLHSVNDLSSTEASYSIVFIWFSW